MKEDLRGDNFVESLLFPICALYEIVEVGDVGLVMLAVVILKGLSGKHLSKAITVIR